MKRSADGGSEQLPDDQAHDGATDAKQHGGRFRLLLKAGGLRVQMLHGVDERGIELLQGDLNTRTRAAEVDEAEDAQYGRGKRGDELPEELARRESRLKKIRAAKAELEQEAETGKKAGGHDPKVADPEQAKSEAKGQRNFTNPESRIMVDGANQGSLIQAQNAQAAVDSQAQDVSRKPAALTLVTGAKTTSVMGA